MVPFDQTKRRSSLRIDRIDTPGAAYADRCAVNSSPLSRSRHFYSEAMRQARRAIQNVQIPVDVFRCRTAAA